jgi:hypothetical protein
MEGVGPCHACLPVRGLFHVELANEIVCHEPCIVRKTPCLIAEHLGFINDENIFGCIMSSCEIDTSPRPYFIPCLLQLERAAILGEQKPRSGFQVGLEAFLSGLTALSSNPSL